jgi:hypothetical protein
METNDVNSKGELAVDKNATQYGQPGKSLEPDHLPRTVEELQEWLDKHNGITDKENKPVAEPFHKPGSNGSTYEITFSR